MAAALPGTLAAEEEQAGRPARIAVLGDPATGASRLKAIEAVARSLSVRLQVFAVRRPDDLTPACGLAAAGRADEVIE